MNKTISTLLQSGYDLLLNDQFSEATDQFRKILFLDTDNRLALFGIGICHAMKQEWDLADSQMNHHFQLYPKTNHALLANSFISITTGRFENFSTYIQEAQEVNADYLFYYIFGHQATLFQKFDIAARMFHESILKNNKFANSWERLAFSYYKLNFLQEALSAINRSLELSPTNHFSWGLKVLICDTLELKSEAEMSNNNLLAYQNDLLLSNKYRAMKSLLEDMFSEEFKKWEK